MIHGHGDDIYNYTTGIVSNFSSNIYNGRDLSAFRQYLSGMVEKVHSYPEPGAESLTALLADKYRVEKDNVCVTNGATEAIYLIAQAYHDAKTAIVIPTFSEYEDACTVHRHKIDFIDNLKDIKADTQLVWLCNPNSPTGRVYDTIDLEGIVKQHPYITFVFDQSYNYFTRKKTWSIKDAAQYRNIILLNSLTKNYAIPGLRLGYFTAHADTVKLISSYRMPWSVNQLAIEAGKYLLQHQPGIINLDELLNETQRLQKELQQIEGITVLPTETHFFLCKLHGKKASGLKSHLVQQGILIRDAANFRGLDDSYFRIATQTAVENNHLAATIKQWMQQSY